VREEIAMAFRNDLDAAHARIAALEAEVARLRRECDQLRVRNEAMAKDAAIGRALEAQQQRDAMAAAEARKREADEDRERRLAEKMRREEAEVREKLRRLVAEGDAPAMFGPPDDD